MLYNKPLDELITERTSVRSYREESLTASMIEEIEAYTRQLDDPFSGRVRFQLLFTGESEEGGKDQSTGKSAPAYALGTYGVIKGAEVFIGAAVKSGPLAQVSLGYQFERLVLYLTSLGLGTCYLGGTYNKSEFGRAMGVKENGDELFPVVSPVGWPAEKRRMMDTIMRAAAGSKNRKEWDKLFFDRNFHVPLSYELAGKYSAPLEMVRLAPSASNKQPWRVVREGDYFHFFQAGAADSREESVDVHRVDMGIALCHFHLAVQEAELPGRFALVSPPIPRSDNCRYIASWQMG
ncbi:MAG: nitroreductase family protein [Oscillospiraceae bacterium]